MSRPPPGPRQGGARSTPYGLVATVWSRDIEIALRTARRIRAGTVAINGYSEGEIGTLFGGHKCLASARDNGLEGLEQCTELKTIWITLH